MRGVEVMYKKNSDEVRIIQSREEKMQVLEVWHSDPTSGHFGALWSIWSKEELQSSEGRGSIGKGCSKMQRDLGHWTR